MYIAPSQLSWLKRVQVLLTRLDLKASPEALVVPGSPQPRQNVIILTASFNPPTIAHLALLKAAQAYARNATATHLYAAFSKLTVDKESVNRPLLLDRILLMNSIVQHRFPRAGILLFNRGLYVEQAEAVRVSFPGVKRIIFLIGFDKIVQILDPHYYEDRDASLIRLFEQAELLVAPRGSDGEVEDLHALLSQPQNRRFATFVHELPLNPIYRQISSTHARQDQDRYRNDIPREVRHFMHATRAYAPPLRLQDGSEVDYYAQRVQYLTHLLHTQPL